MSYSPPERRRPCVRLYDIHNPARCGFGYETSCPACQKLYWPSRYFRETSQAHPSGPAVRRPWLSQQALIETLHHYRDKEAVKAAILDLIGEELVELIDARMGGRRK